MYMYTYTSIYICVYIHINTYIFIHNTDDTNTTSTKHQMCQKGLIKKKKEIHKNKKRPKRPLEIKKGHV